MHGNRLIAILMIKLSVQRSVTFTRHNTSSRNCGFCGFFPPSSLAGSITRNKSSSVSAPSNSRLASVSSFQKSAPENCAIELARRKLEIFPGHRSHNASFFGRSFHRFPVTVIAIRSIMTRRTTFVRRRGCPHRSYFAALSRSLVEKVHRVQRERRVGTMPINEVASLRVK